MKKAKLTPNYKEHVVIVRSKPGYAFFKRFFDIVLSGLLLLSLSWLIGLVLLIKFLEDFHNPIYVSTRIGKNGKPFKFHKIRSMVVGAEKMKDDLKSKGLNEADGPAFKIKNDPRVTKFGRFIRKTSFDELLQFWDVFIGNMSLIGPRPPIPEEVEKYTEYQKHRLDVKGGLTCFWQISKNRHSIPFEEWVALDIMYIENRSFWVDTKLFFKTIFFVIFDHTGE